MREHPATENPEIPGVSVERYGPEGDFWPTIGRTVWSFRRGPVTAWRQPWSGWRKWESRRERCWMTRGRPSVLSPPLITFESGLQLSRTTLFLQAHVLGWTTFQKPQRRSLTVRSVRAGAVVPSEVKLGFITLKIDGGQAPSSEGAAGEQGRSRRASDAGPKRPTPLRTTGNTARRASAPHIHSGRPQAENDAADHEGAGQHAGKAGPRQDTQSAEDGEKAGPSQPYQHASKL